MTRVYVHICGMGVYIQEALANPNRSKPISWHLRAFSIPSASICAVAAFSYVSSLMTRSLSIPFPLSSPSFVFSHSFSLAVCRVRHAELGKLQSPMKAFGSLQQCEQYVYPSPSLPHPLSFAVSLTVHLSVQLSASLALRACVCVCAFLIMCLPTYGLSPTLLQARPIWEQRNVPHVLSC